MVKHMNKPKGATSKRMTLKNKYKVKRLVKNHLKKQKKEAKKMKDLGLVSKKKIQDSISNIYPFKAQVLTHQKYLKSLPKEKQVVIYEAPIKELKHSKADILIELIDIRNPLKLRPIFNLKKMEKIHLFVLNYCHLVSKDIAESWQRYFAKQGPCVFYSDAVESFNSGLHSFFNKQKGTVYASSVGKVPIGLKKHLGERLEGYGENMANVDLQIIIDMLGITKLCLHYKIPDFTSPKELIEHVAKANAKDFIKQGNVLNNEVEQKILSDFLDGIIKFQNIPPK